MQPKHYSRSEHLRALWPWLPLWTALALLAIFAHGPMPMYSTRTLAVAWEMWSGHHWIVPYFNGAPYSHKVPLLFWLIHAGWFVFGVNDIWPRVLEVGFGAAQLVLAATIARRLFPDRPWVAKATPWMLAALAYAFLFSLQIMYEVLLGVCVLSAMLTLTPSARRVAPRWWLFGFWIGAGLLTKGPVMLLHVAFPWLLGPLWSDYARREKARWYGFGLLAVLGGLLMLGAWLWPALELGGHAYAEKLLFKQTGGRVVDSFAHARPMWWYLQWLPVLLFPFAAWPRAWVAVASLRRPLLPGIRFLLCWLLPVLLGFSLISGKQLYYPLPEFGGAVMLIAAALALLRERHPRLAATPWLGGWAMALGGFAFGILLLALPSLAGRPPFASHWMVDLAVYSRYFGVIYLLLGLLLLLRGRGELRRIAIGGMIGTFVANALFTVALWTPYDLRQASALFAQASAEGHATASVGYPEGQFTFRARLRTPVQQLESRKDILDFAAQHPDGLVATYRQNADLMPTDLRYALLVQPFRGDWLVLWKASTLAAIRSGETPPEPAQPTRLLPSPDYWRYRSVRAH
ncbi:ArnT family glycosyltransferase [Oleiagrimonas soli]|uniref:4-amino-4-deoxy-L-arabinose transferase-like glycosyltransferase n=1 Tax=Oleiagrimonas soli TaxID=1543381 RepID=A0A099CUT3_9GAMM|nr:glycosyltransferase family 39 protein [Oleiagrimonas soli]KGI76780.1 glycosyl transferase [Oleiagrimonas soli]MBB6184976.1 4-amino-4-deoxy-L-arabinose transferase-like glycosyltransferase [Oleiagrimonas soli]